MAPPLDYKPVPEAFKLPAGANFGGTSGIAINSKGNIFVLHRGPMPVMEFDADGAFIRGFGDGLFDRPHGLRIDAQDNIWATDVAAHVVYKFNPGGRLEMVLGVKNRPGEWHEFGHLRLFNEPNEAVVGPTGDVFVLQGHGKGESLVLKFDTDGNFIKSWGKKGKGPGEFDLPHSLVISDLYRRVLIAFGAGCQVKHELRLKVGKGGLQGAGIENVASSPEPELCGF